MSKLNKIKNGEYIGGDKYTITPDAGGKSRVVFSPDNILTEPTPVGAEILNEMQLNQVYTLDTTRSVDGQKEVYIATLEGFTEFDSPDLSFNLKINSENTNSQTYLRLNGIDYLIECKIGNLKAGSIVYAKKVNSVIKVIGNKNFGVVEGDILEGHRMAQIQGVEKFGGDVQTAGTKKVGYAYWCTVNKDMYICKVENSLNYIDAAYFEAFSNNALLGKLNNLFYYDSGSKAVIKKGSHGIIEEKHNIVFSGNHTVGQTYKVTPSLIKDIIMIDYSILDSVYDRFFTNHIEASSTLGGIAFKRIVGGSTLAATVTFIGR